MEWREYWLRNSWWRRLGVLILNHLQYSCMPSAKSYVLECGCGLSRNNKYGDAWVGLDIEKTVRPTIQGDVNFLPFKDGAFKVVYSFGLIEHLNAPHHAILEMTRVGNQVFFGIPKKNGLVHILHKVYDVWRRKWIFPPENYYCTKDFPYAQKIRSILQTIDFYKINKRNLEGD